MSQNSIPFNSALIIGSGPNGLAAAIMLADAGYEVTVLESADTIGGGLRSAELLTSDVTHDICSAVHPLAQASPFYRQYAHDLQAQGLAFAAPEVDLVHALDHGRAAVLYQDLSKMESMFGDSKDGRRWRRLFSRLVEHADEVADEFLQPVLHVPKHPLLLAEFGLHAMTPASLFWQRFTTEEAKALYAGIAAHAFVPLHRVGSAAPGTMITVLGHAYGWPVAVGGSQSIADALVGVLHAKGGRVETGYKVSSYDEIAGADVVMLDTSVETAASILGDQLPTQVRRAWSRFRHGPAVVKVDYVIEGDVPWQSEDAGKAGTVHLGGHAAEVAHAERLVWKGQLPEHPFVLVGQQYVADVSRSHVVGGRRLNPLWAYAHVPAGWEATGAQGYELVTSQIERFAPGFRDTVVDYRVSTPGLLESHNANYVGGDISCGANNLWQLLARPRLGWDPYFTGVPGVYLCSAATPPGAGVHFMGGMNSAEATMCGSYRK